MLYTTLEPDAHGDLKRALDGFPRIGVTDNCGLPCGC